MEFVEGKIEEERVFGGAVFPKTLNPPCMEGYRVSELVEEVREKPEWLHELLQHHSAILFRGFHMSSAQDFGRVVEAFGWEEMPYMGVTSRNKVADGVHTANEAPLDQPINFHHEMALIKQFPSKIIFFCSEPPPKGGETSILHSHVTVDRMEEKVPDFVTKISRNGLIFRLKAAKRDDSNNLISRTWKWFLKTEDEVEAEKRAKEKLSCSSVNFNEDGSAEFVFGPMNPIREFGGKRVWFNPILGSSFADGSCFPAEAFDAYKKATSENCVDIKWQKGDILLLDNLCVQHARRPGKPPRVIFVSLCQQVKGGNGRAMYVRSP